MTREEAIKRLELSLGTYEALEIGEDAIKMAIKALRNIGKIEYLVNTYKQKGRAPHRTITMEQLADVLGIEQKEE